jgi:putative iron-regulated protein
MKRRALLSFLPAAALPTWATTPAADAADALKRETVLTYARIVHANYTDCHAAARSLRSALANLVAKPSESALEAARKSWTAARRPYGLSEVFRYYAGPIDDADGPEPLLNAWPLDESWIEAVPGSPTPGIIGNDKEFPSLSPQLIAELNQRDGEKNVACGWHAIEFLLWGQDRSTNGPGSRPWTDFSTAPYASRRCQYLLACADILVLYLDDLVRQWAPGQLGNYRAVFEEDTAGSLERILMGIIFLSGTELAGERLQVAFDTMEQEDEQSCFSDTTHLDLIANADAIRNAWSGQYAEAPDRPIAGKGLRDLASHLHPAIATTLDKAITSLTERARAIPPPFDAAIRGSDDSPGRQAVFSLITAAEDVAIHAKKLASALGCRIPDVPPEDIEG